MERVESNSRSPCAPRPLVLCPLGRWGWDRNAVAAHLSERQAQIVGGLARRVPWVGIDETTLAELYLEAVELVSRHAAERNRSGWHRREHLERAVIAAFRHLALKHWRIAKAQKRQVDRDTVELTPELHGHSRDAYAQLAEADISDLAVARDWLAQLRGTVHDFWEPVLMEGCTFQDAADRLALPDHERQMLWRHGIEQLRRFRSLHEQRLVCRLRAPAIAALRAGATDPVDLERARAHLTCCPPCRLAYQSAAPRRRLPPA